LLSIGVYYNETFMSRKEDKSETIAVMGLGYAGLPLLSAFAEHFPTIGFDVSEEVIAHVRTRHPDIALTTDPSKLASAHIIFVVVPTPIHDDLSPDLSFLTNACTLLAKNMQRDATVVFESTVYPGTTEEICIPLLERESGLQWKKDFWVAYSPERINPGDKEHGFTKVVKVVAGDMLGTAQRIQALYAKVIPAGTHLAPSIKVAEAAKLLENVQRDVNIALANEYAQLMEALSIDNRAVLAAAKSKWNFMSYEPGLPGGHCIGIDSYYLMHKARQAGFDPSLIRISRAVNEGIGVHIFERALLHMQKTGGKKVALLGLSFKENVSDMRNSGALKLIGQFKKHGCELFINDPHVSNDAARSHHIELVPLDTIPQVDVMIIAVAHTIYKNYKLEDFAKHLVPGGLMIDIKAILDKDACTKGNIALWQL
jgi:UDP-N-acetyl-D-galactosamine dehydrogenase